MPRPVQHNTKWVVGELAEYYIVDLLFSQAMSRRNLDKYYSIYSSKPRGVIFNHPEVQASLGFQPGFKRLSPDDPSMHGPDITAYVRQVR